MEEKKDYFIYYFADGTKSVLTANDVGQKWIDILHKLEKEEQLGHRRETRRHLPLEVLVELGAEPSALDAYFLDNPFEDMEDELLQESIRELLPQQRELLKRRFANLDTVSEIAEDDGVSKSAVSRKFARIYKKIENFL